MPSRSAPLTTARAVAPDQPPVIGYVLARFPLLSETFILRELLELERQGARLRVYPLRQVQGRVRHESLARLRAPVWCAPWLGLGCHLRCLRQAPGRYAATLGAVLWRNRRDRNLLAGAVAYWHKSVAIAERARRDGVTHLHAHYATHPALTAYVVHRLAGIPFSFTVHAHDLYCHPTMLPHKMRAAEWIATISRFNQQRLRALQAHSSAPTPVHCIRCGVESNARGEAAPRAAEPGPLRLLAVGSLQAYKGHRVLLQAVGLLQARGVAVHCRLVGGGPLRPALERQIRRLGLRHTELLGAATEATVARQLQWADVFAMPSIVDPRTGQMEGIPVALMEAMAAGCAVVASHLSGIPELVWHEHNGLLVPPGDAAALAEALTRLQAPALRQRLGGAARLAVRERFDLPSNVGRLAELFGLARPAQVAA